MLSDCRSQKELKQACIPRGKPQAPSCIGASLSAYQPLLARAGVTSVDELIFELVPGEAGPAPKHCPMSCSMPPPGRGPANCTPGYLKFSDGQRNAVLHSKVACRISPIYSSRSTTPEARVRIPIRPPRCACPLVVQQIIRAPQPPPRKQPFSRIPSTSASAEYQTRSTA